MRPFPLFLVKLLRWRVVANSLGLLMSLMSILLSIPLFLSLTYTEDPKAFLLPAIISLTFGILLFSLGETSEDISIREAFTIVSLGWFAASLVGALPFFFHHFPFVDALFESVSGFTTTGATIIDLNQEVCCSGEALHSGSEEWES